MLKIRDVLLPLLKLDELLQVPKDSFEDPAEPTAYHIVVVESGATRYGIVVDRIDDCEEIVVKPLCRHLKNCVCLAGATILGDGHIAPILDVSGIANYAEIQAVFDQIRSECDEEKTKFVERQMLLSFVGSAAELFSVPMALVSRIERVTSTQIKTVGGFPILQSASQPLPTPLIQADKFVDVSSFPDVEKPYVVIFKCYGREFGLIAPQLKDITEVAAEVDGDTFASPGIAGSVMVAGELTRLIDLHDLTEIAYPRMIQDLRKSLAEPGRSSERTVLLAEDSSFFRRKISQFLTNEGFTVTEAEDGQIAWNILSGSKEGFDLIVTDIEMPHLNGFQLSRKIRADQKHCETPIIAVTSLSSDDDRERGRDAGIDEYQIKLDRDQLIASVLDLIGKQDANQSRKHIATTDQN